MLIPLIFVAFMPFISPILEDIPESYVSKICKYVQVLPNWLQLEMCDYKTYNIPDFGKVFRFEADVLENLDINNMYSEKRSQAAVEASEVYRAMTELKVLVIYSDLKNRNILADYIESYAKKV